MYAFVRERVNNCSVEGDTVTTTESGFINEKIFFQWIQTFSQCIPSTVKRPIVLTFDGYSAHVSSNVVMKALELQILLVCLPPNATHLLQPLDVAVFFDFQKASSRIYPKLHVINWRVEYRQSPSYSTSNWSMGSWNARLKLGCGLQSIWLVST
jgi:hypothetical protein